MAYDLDFDTDRQLALFTVKGSFPQDEMFQMIRDLIDHPKFREGYDALVDLTAVEDIALVGADIRSKVAIDKALLPKVGSARWAIVATQDAVFGLARMFQIMMDETSVEVGTFRNRGDAEAWLDERCDTSAPPVSEG